MSARKRKVGRPPLHGKAGARYQVHLPPHVATLLRKLGEGSLSGGIVRLALAGKSEGT